MAELETRETVESILRLRRAERLAGREAGADIAATREFLEGVVGPTVRAAEAARLLGVSHPALSRWIDQDQIAAVLTPAGRLEIPLSDLVELIEEVQRAREEGWKRPLARVIRERRRRSEETVDIDRLLRQPRRRTHRTPELHALAYHRLVAERLDDQVVEAACRRLARWRESGRIHPSWASKWEQILTKPLPGVAKAISADTPAARELRQTSPFAGVLTHQERRRLAQAVEERLK